VIRQTVARVDLQAIKSNFRAIADFLGARARIIAVVKANAYGHGAQQVALALEEAGAAMLACADIEEGIVLREASAICAACSTIASHRRSRRPGLRARFRPQRHAREPGSAATSRSIPA
jgi:alanine racemase